MENNRPLGWTTLDEAKKLVEAGLDPNTADMYYHYNTVEIKGVVKYISGPELATSPYSEGVKTAHMLYASPMMDESDKVYPCWSIGTLLELIPKLVGERNSSLLYHAYFNFELSPRYKYPLRWVARYSGSIKQKDNEGDFDGQTMFSKDVSTEFTYETAIETVCDTTIWLLENGYIEKHEE